MRESETLALVDSSTHPKLDLLAAIPPVASPGGSGRGRAGRGGGFDAVKMTAVLKLAAEKVGWGKSRPRGEGQGFAITYTNNAYVAIVADVKVGRDGELAIRRLTAAVDAGLIINLSAAEKDALEAFLRSFTDTAFLTDPKFSDPFSR